MDANVPRAGIRVQRASEPRSSSKPHPDRVLRQPWTPRGSMRVHAMIRLGVDTLCWHLRLENGTVTLEDVLDHAAALEAEFVQVNLHHVRHRQVGDLDLLAARADELGLRLLASGDFLGQGRNGDPPALGIGRVQAWLERAVALGSPVLRVVSGFYRAELLGRPELIAAERQYVVSVLHGALPVADAAGVALLLEN